MLPVKLSLSPLRPCRSNSRYFAHDDDRPVYLTGSHHWDNLADNEERPGDFDFTAYLDRLEEWGHNFVRFWTQWCWSRRVHPQPYLRSGPELAGDDRPAFDLDRFNPEYFERLKHRAETAAERGFYVSVMVFQGWSIRDYGEGDPWPAHPYHRRNNCNGIDGDPERLGEGGAVHSLAVPAITRLQERYVEQVVDTVGHLPNVIYEVSNESPRESLPWQHHILEYLRRVEADRGRVHPIGITSPYGGRSNQLLMAGPADWISPDHRGGFRRAPPPATGAKVILLDTDHLWGVGGDRRWVWKSFTRGYNPIYMDPLPDGTPDADSKPEEVRLALGKARSLAQRIELAKMLPMGGRSSSGYCLAGAVEDREQILVYLPFGRGTSVTLARPGSRMQVEWIRPGSGETVDGGTVLCRTRHRFRSPFSGDSLLYVRGVAEESG